MWQSTECEARFAPVPKWQPSCYSNSMIEGIICSKSICGDRRCQVWPFHPNGLGEVYGYLTQEEAGGSWSLNTTDWCYLISAFGIWRSISLNPSLWLCSLTPLHHPCVRRLRRTRLGWSLPKRSVWLNQTDTAVMCAAELLVFDCA